MSLDAAFLISFLGIFIRCTAMLLASPLYGSIVPVTIRIFGGLIISLSLVPVLGDHFAVLPNNLYELIALGMREAFMGMLIGFVMQMLVAVTQMAGMMLDLQVGIGSAQIFNPTTGVTATPLGQFKFWLGLVLIFILNGHQMMIRAFVHSYEIPGLNFANLSGAVASLGNTFGTLIMLSMQIAVPVIAVTMIIDIASGLINKAVPQTQPFLLSLPAKMALGMVALSIGLPSLVGIVRQGIEITFAGLGPMLGG